MQIEIRNVDLAKEALIAILHYKPRFSGPVSPELVYEFLEDLQRQIREQEEAVEVKEEWRDIPDFSGYQISNLENVRLSDGPRDLYPTNAQPISSDPSLPRKFNLLNDKNQGCTVKSSSLLYKAFPELEKDDA